MNIKVINVYDDEWNNCKSRLNWLIENQNEGTYWEYLENEDYISVFKMFIKWFIYT